MKTAHQLARELLAGPDLPIFHFDPSLGGYDDEADTSCAEVTVEQQDSELFTDPDDGIEKQTVPFLTLCGAHKEEHGIDEERAVFPWAFRAMADSTFETHREKGWLDRELNHGEQIALMHSELSEGLEGLRKDLKDDKLPHRPMIEVELADVVIRIMNYAKQTGIDVAGAIVEKAEFNKTRPQKHGGKSF